MLEDNHFGFGFELQILPWENMPILRNQEVYRMPSVGSIFATLDRCCQNQELIGPTIPAIPLIDPLDSYYLLNSDVDLRKTQVEFENWFKVQNIEELNTFQVVKFRNSTIVLLLYFLEAVVVLFI